jgi:hypothetical protein
VAFPSTDRARFGVSQLILRQSSFEEDVEETAALIRAPGGDACSQ